MRDYLHFDSMITPKIITFIYWVMLAASAIAGLALISKGFGVMKYSGFAGFGMIVAAPILVVGTTGDPATPYRWAQSLADQLESGHLITFHGEGHTAYGENACVDATVDEYLLEGTVPAKDPDCR